MHYIIDSRVENKLFIYTENHSFYQLLTTYIYLYSSFIIIIAVLNNIIHLHTNDKHHSSSSDEFFSLQQKHCISKIRYSNKSLASHWGIRILMRFLV